jgi:hypothetical protein
MLTIRLFYVYKKSADIKLNFQIIEELKSYKFILGKKIDKELYKYIIRYLFFLLLFIIIIIADLFTTHHEEQITDALLQKSKIENIIISSIFNAYEIIAGIHRMVLIFSVDFVVIYLLLLAKVYMKQTTKFVNYANTFAEIRRCIIIHQRVLE